MSKKEHYKNNRFRLKHVIKQITQRKRLKTINWKTDKYRFCLRHVGDDSVCDDEEDEVLRAVQEGPGDVGHVVDGRREVGRTVKLDSG